MKIIGIILICLCFAGVVATGVFLWNFESSFPNFAGQSGNAESVPAKDSFKDNFVTRDSVPVPKGWDLKMYSNAGVSVHVPKTWKATPTEGQQDMIAAWTQVQTDDDFSPVYMIYSTPRSSDPDYVSIEKFQVAMKKDAEQVPGLTYLSSTAWRGPDGMKRYSFTYTQVSEDGKQLKGKTVFIFHNNSRVDLYVMDNQSTFDASERIFDSFVDTLAVI